MKVITLILLVSMLLSSEVFARRSGGSSRSYSHGHSRSGHSITHVRSYHSKSGKTVKSHYRTRKDHTKTNNWSTKGNTNPFTGKKGSK